MKVKLFNSLGCELDAVDGSAAEVAARIASWIECGCDGDVIKVVAAENDDPADPVADWSVDRLAAALNL